MKYLLIGLLFLSVTAHAGERTAISKINKDITFTVTENPCTFFSGLPDGAPLKEAYAYDAGKSVKIVGCALDYGTKIEFQLVNEAEKKHYQFMLPSADFI